MDAVFQNQKIESWVELRILNFLNAAQTVEDIVGKVLDDPNAGGSATIGETVAQRILEKRNSLAPFGRFDSISQLEGIPGLGEDKIRDLIYTFGVRAADAFRKSMYDGIILDNWQLEHHTYYFPSEEEFLLTATIESNFVQHVAYQVEQISLQKFGNEEAAYLANLLAQQSYLDRYDSAHVGSYAFALWFYQFDQDNWFSFERVRTTIEPYLSYYSERNAAYEQQFVLFKGFPNGATLVRAVTTPDLPVVINPVENAITIWTAALYD